MPDLTLHVMQILGCVHFASPVLPPHREQVPKQSQNYVAESRTGTALYSRKMLFNLRTDCMNTG